VELALGALEFGPQALDLGSLAPEVLCFCRRCVRQPRRPDRPGLAAVGDRSAITPQAIGHPSDRRRLGAGTVTAPSRAVRAVQR
jgi:hypothetical protein